MVMVIVYAKNLIFLQHFYTQLMLVIIVIFRFLFGFI